MTPHDISKFSVTKKQCQTCPFRTDKRGKHPDEELVAKIQMRVLTESNQICHHHKLLDKPKLHLCRGAKDFQLEIFNRLNLLLK